MRFGAICCVAASAVLASANAWGAWRTLGAVTAQQRGADVWEATTQSGAHLRIAFADADTLRVRLAPGGTFETDQSYALAAAPARVALTLREDAAHGTIELAPAAAAHSVRVSVRLAPELALTVYNAHGDILLADDPARPMAFDPDGGVVQASERRSATELYYGFGEKALPLSRHGQYMTMWNSDTPGYPRGLDPIYESIPFFIAQNGGVSFGVFLDNTYRTYFDMGKTDPARYTFGADGGELNYYVFGGGAQPSPRTVLAGYTALTGRAPLPPLWALGYQQSRYSYTPAAKASEIAHEFRERKIPADVIYFDIGYMDGYRIFTWSPSDFPQPEKLLAELHGLGFHAVTIVDPGIKLDEGFPIYRSGKPFYTRRADGSEYHAAVWPGLCAFPDFTEPSARAWFGSLYRGFLDQGVDGFWNDMNEPGVFVPPDWKLPVLVHDPMKTFPLDNRHAGDGLPGTHVRYHNVYGMQMARATFEGLQKLRPAQRPFVLTRAGYAGVQRYSAVWTGDNDATWDHLALSIPMLSSLSISGVPFVGADIGGFNATPSAELYTRWLEAAALTPFMRTHSAIDTAQREPWTYGEPYTSAARGAIELRYRLLPYLYTLFAANAREGAPPMRPLWFDFPADVKGLLVEDEFLLGADVLVAPVVHEGAVARRIYFPRGTDWIDWYDGTRHAGGSDAEIAAPLARLPLFVRAGAALPTSDVAQDTTEQQKLPLIVTAALGPGSTTGDEIYQDSGDGPTTDAERIALHVDGERVRIDGPKAEKFRRIGAVEFIGVAAKPRAVRVDGKVRADFDYDAGTRRVRVTIPSGTPHEVMLMH